MNFTRFVTWLQTLSPRRVFRTFVYLILFPFVWNWRLIIKENIFSSNAMFYWTALGAALFCALSVIVGISFSSLFPTIAILLIGYFSFVPFIKLGNFLSLPLQFLRNEYKVAEESKSKLVSRNFYHLEDGQIEDELDFEQKQDSKESKI